MGTVVLFQIEDAVSEHELDRLCRSAMEILDDADQRFSLYKPQSEISQLVKGEKAWDSASREQLLVRDLCASWSTKTSGFFDARAGSEYDPSGLVKTWAAQNAVDFLQANGIRQFTLNAGGDIFLSADLDSDMLNRVGLSNLRSIASEFAGANMILDLKETGYRAVCTSGSVERGEHIWGTSQTQDFMQVTVVSEDLVTADIWATALSAGGRNAWEVFLGSAGPDLTAIAIGKDGSMVAAPGFTRLLANV